MHLALPAHAAFVLDRLTDAGYAAYVVGGCVRDSLLGRVPDDWDIATDALPSQTIAALAGIRVLETGIRHGTVTALTDSGAVEITTFRIDGAYTDNRRPDSVQFTRTLSDDLARRDFTVNALAYSPTTGLVDLHGGTDDLARRRLRCVGNPDLRFKEDALRILRALRFAATLGFTLSEATAASLVSHRALLAQISAERLYAELLRLICGANVDAVLRDYHVVLQEVLPALPPPGHPLADVAPQPLLRLVMLLYALPPSEADAALLRLRCDNATRRAVVLLLSQKNLPLAADAPSLRRLLCRMEEPRLRALLAVKAAHGEDVAPFSLALERELSAAHCRTRASLAVNGKDLSALGFTGAEIGAALQMLLSAVIDERLPNERDAQLQWIQAQKKPLSEMLSHA